MIGVVVAVTLVNVAIILLYPPPAGDPVTAHEIAELLNGEKLIPSKTTLQVENTDALPLLDDNMPRGQLRRAISQFMHSEEQEESIMTQTAPRTMSSQEELPTVVQTEGFDPVIFGSFTVALEQPDGSWRTVSGGSDRIVQKWRSRMTLWILFSVLLVLPIAWWFSKRIARPIRAFGNAAELLGTHQDLERVEVSGPAEIRQAAKALNDMQARLQKYVKERTSMVGAIAHDLRTPLSRLHFHLLPAPLSVRQHVEAEIAEMEQMIAVTLDFVQNETRAQVSELIELGLLIEGVVDDQADLGKDVRMTASVSVTIDGDPVLLRRVFANLIQNAVSYGNRARASVRVDAGFAIVEIIDDGPGMSEADLIRAFEPFYRAESSRNRLTGGMGLGLAIVYSAVQAHGGTIDLINLSSGGLCARVSLPIR
ncbi:HAMP domain-containing sensor histidine kinase [Parasphingorhabdus sp.]|uniref:HAMP domain-containing sensor histidine kinase n=1 Tax=Parasphingorhabdus sp. TaxID=2709688 RepID=UPI003A8F05BE